MTHRESGGREAGRQGIPLAAVGAADQPITRSMLVASRCMHRRAAAGAARFARTWSSVCPAGAYEPAALAGRTGLCVVGLCCTWSPGLVMTRSARSTHRWEADASASDVLRQMLISKGASQVEELSWDGGKLMWLWRRLWQYVDGSWVRLNVAPRHHVTRCNHYVLIKP